MAAGGETRITDETKVLILDCFETLVMMEDRRYRPRNGISGFLTYYQRAGKGLFVHSDTSIDLVTDALQQAGLHKWFQGIFHAEHTMTVEGSLHPLKDLSLACRSIGIQNNEAVFIGDSPLDERAAEIAKMPFIRVPRSEDIAFSFTRLIGGVSRYKSEVFMDRLDDFYNKDA